MKRVWQREEKQPRAGPLLNHDAYGVALRDGRMVFVGAMELRYAGLTATEANLLRLAQEIAYDEEYRR